MDHLAQAFEGLGTLILVIGVLWSFVLAALAWRRAGSGRQAYKAPCALLRFALAARLRRAQATCAREGVALTI
jgi:hypothetical protein